MLKRCEDFARANPAAIPTVALAADVAARTRAQSLERRLMPVLGGGGGGVVVSAVECAQAAY
jgi:hypothetical protein